MPKLSKLYVSSSLPSKNRATMRCRRLGVKFEKSKRDTLYYMWYLKRHCDTYQILAQAFEHECLYISTIANWVTTVMRYWCTSNFKASDTAWFRDWWQQHHDPNTRQDYDMPTFDFWSFLHAKTANTMDILQDKCKPYDDIKSKIQTHIENGQTAFVNFRCPCVTETTLVAPQLSITKFKMQLFTDIADAYDSVLRENIVYTMRSRIRRFLKTFYAPPVHTPWPQNYENTLNVLFQKTTGAAVTTECRRHINFIMDTFSDSLPVYDNNDVDGIKMFANLKTNWIHYMPFLLDLKQFFKTHGVKAFNIFEIYPNYKRSYTIMSPVIANTLRAYDIYNLYVNHC